MIVLTYDKEIIISLFFERTKNNNPAPNDLQQFDSDLRDARDADLVDIMTELNIARDPHNKSRILMDSVHASPGTLREMIREACQLFLNTRNI